MHILHGFCLNIILNFGMVHAGGHLYIKLIHYINPGGNGENRRTCDGRFGITFSACDHRFVLCADKQTGGGSMDKCYFGRMETPVFHNADALSFPNEISGMKNPILFNVSSWPASGIFKLKVDIWDYDKHSRDEHVEYLYRKLSIKPRGHMRNYTGQRFILRGRTRLTVELAVVCDEYYFGQSCDVYCQQDAVEHYLCDNKGQKVCVKGWRGPGCRVIDHCANSPCRYNGKCLSAGNDSFVCECENGYAGNLCDIQLCKDNICKNNGTCYIVNDTNVCDCPSKWTGETCETRLQNCDDVICFNNGTCEDVLDTFRCHCEVGWQGDACLLDVDECEDEPCQEHSKCINTKGSYICKCDPGWTGEHCTEGVNECKNGSCPMDSECLKTMGSSWCRWVENWARRTCKSHGVKCSLHTCRNNDTCILGGNETHCHRREPCPELEGSPTCTSNCWALDKCNVSAVGKWTCKCEVDENREVPVFELCSTNNSLGFFYDLYPDLYLKDGSKGSFALCRGINLTAISISDPENLSREEAIHVVVLADAKYATWLLDHLKNCSRYLVKFEQINYQVGKWNKPAHNNEAGGFVNWYPLTGLLVVPLVFVIVCFVAFRNKLKKSRGSGEHLALSKAVYTD